MWWKLPAIFATLIALLVVTALIGLLLPRDHVAARTARYRQSPQQVWEAITTYAKQADWRDLTSIEQLENRNGHTVWQEEHSRGDVLIIEVLESDAPRRHVGEVVDNRNFGDTWTYEIEPADDGCRLTITERGEIYNPLFRFIARFVIGYNSTKSTYLTQLAQQFGDDVEFVD